MDCCRPDLRDVTDEQAQELVRAWQQDPALHRHWLAIRAWDTRLAEVFFPGGTPVPDGLQDRLLAALRDAAATPVTPAGPAAPEGAVARRASDAPRVPSRRWAAVAASCLVAASALWALTLGWVGSRDALTAAQVVADARQWLAHLDVQAWRSGTPPLEAFPLVDNVRVEIVGWQPCVTGWGAAGVVYQAVITPDRAAAVLFVIPSRLGNQLPNVPPLRPDATTEDLCVGVWKADGFLYVLVVPGRDSDYRQALVAPSFA